MSSNATDPSTTKKPASAAGLTSGTPSSKGKSKVIDPNPEGEEEEEEDEEMGSEEEEDEEEEEDSFEEIDPSAILPSSRRTRGVRVDYASKEALEKAGLKGNEDDEDDNDEDVKMD